MEPLILAMPVEILTRIFEACDDFRQVIALASACRYTHAAWVTNSSTIIWNVGKSQIRSFDDALMAVRATAIVLKAYQAGTIPPAVTVISSLSGKSRIPDLAELKEVLNMQHLVRCIEHIYFYSSCSGEFTQYNPDQDEDPEQFGFKRYPSTLRRFPECLKQNIPGAENATIDSFRDGFYRAMYRLLLAGAVLTRAYVEPLFRAREDADPVIKNRFFVHWGSGEYYSQEFEDFGDQIFADVRPTEVDLAYIRQSAVYNFDVPDWSEIGQWRDREYEKCFGPFASWIVEDGRIGEQREPQDPNEIEPSWAQNRGDVGAVRELMLLLVAYDHLNDHFDMRSRIPYMQKQGNRTVTIVRFGQFHLEQITMPVAVEDLQGTYLRTEEHPALVGTKGEDIPHQFEMFFTSYFLPTKSRSPIPSWRKHPGPPLELELWNFALRRYLDLTFKSGTFWMPQLECLWWREVGRGEIFLNPNWAIVQKYVPGVISWDYRNQRFS